MMYLKYMEFDTLLANGAFLNISVLFLKSVLFSSILYM